MAKSKGCYFLGERKKRKDSDKLQHAKSPKEYKMEL